MRLLFFALILSVLCGCAPRTTGRVHTHIHSHDHGSGPHKGTVTDWGDDGLHVEFVVDHDKKEATVYILDGEAEKNHPVGCDKLTLKILNPPFEIDLKPVSMPGEEAGTSSRFVGIHDNLGKVQEFEGTITGVVDGKKTVGKFKEEPEGK